MELLKFTSRPGSEEQWLKGVELFSKLTDRQIRKLARLLLARHYAKGRLLIQKGDTGLGMFLVVSGSVEVFDTAGGVRVSLAHLGPGQCVGEMSLIDDRPRSANVEAAEDTHCFLMTRDSFNGLTRRDPEVLWGIVPLIVERLRHADARLAEIATRSAAASVAQPPAAADEPGARRPARTSTIVPGSAIDAELEAANRSNEESLLSALTELSTASFLMSSSAFLLGTQEVLQWLWPGNSVGQRLRRSEQVISSLTSSLQENMNGASKRLLDVAQGPLASIKSLFDR
jgi:CRP-like cAMP-binding protein